MIQSGGRKCVSACGDAEVEGYSERRDNNALCEVRGSYSRPLGDGQRLKNHGNHKGRHD